MISLEVKIFLISTWAAKQAGVPVETMYLQGERGRRDGLGPYRRTIMIAAAALGATYSEISAVTGRSRSAVSSLIARGSDVDHALALQALEAVDLPAEKPEVDGDVGLPKHSGAAKEFDEVWRPPLDYCGAPWTYNEEVARRRAEYIARRG